MKQDTVSNKFQGVLKEVIIRPSSRPKQTRHSLRHNSFWDVPGNKRSVWCSPQIQEKKAAFVIFMTQSQTDAAFGSSYPHGLQKLCARPQCILGFEDPSGAAFKFGPSSAADGWRMQPLNGDTAAAHMDPPWPSVSHNTLWRSFFFLF